MVYYRYIVKSELLNIFLKGIPVVAVVFNSYYLALAVKKSSLNHNRLGRNRTDIFAFLDLHLGEDNSSYLASHILDAPLCKRPVVYTESHCCPCVGVKDYHSGRCIDTPVDHVTDIVFLDRTCRITSFVVNDFTFTKSGIIHSVENVGMSRLGKYKNTSVHFAGRYQILIFPCNIKDFYMFKIYIRIL